MNSGVQIQFDETDGRLVARPHGTMDADNGSDFAAAVEQRALAAAGPRSVTIDLAALDAIALGGVRAVLRLARTLKSAGRDLDFTGGGDAVRHMFEQAGFNQFFAFTPPLHSHRGHHDAAS